MSEVDFERADDEIDDEPSEYYYDEEDDEKTADIDGSGSDESMGGYMPTIISKTKPPKSPKAKKKGKKKKKPKKPETARKKAATGFDVNQRKVQTVSEQDKDGVVKQMHIPHISNPSGMQIANM
mmetsp:Transcript_23562/g.16725  ORF Transcript_23562/g.16725 Transcript_23562/m.16725 type:complete len:124 (-) Transcript_23562:1765-2136(-)